MESPNKSLNNEITFYISIISGMLLTISEVLPYIKTIPGNSIIEVFVNFLVKKSNIPPNNTSSNNTSSNNTSSNNTSSNNTSSNNKSSNDASSNDERSPLLIESKISSQVSNFTINSPNISLTFNSPNKITTKTTELQDSI
jgi:hypothetical protein